MFVCQKSTVAPQMHPKTKKGVKRKADTTTPVITTVAGKIPTAGSPDHENSHNEEDSVGVEDLDAVESAPRVPARLQTIGRRESSGRTIRPPRSRDLDSEENVSVNSSDFVWYTVLCAYRQFFSEIGKISVISDEVFSRM